MTHAEETRVLRVSLEGVEPEIWRVFEVEGGITLGALSQILIQAMDWDDSHLHLFRLGEAVYSEIPPMDMYEPLGEDEEKITVGDALPQVGSTISWEYDMGDGWAHSVSVVEVDTVKEGVRYPALYDGARACPPEDCGGPWGYMEILQMLADPEVESEGLDREETMEWLGPDFDPDRLHFKPTARPTNSP